MTGPDNFIQRWARLKRESDAAQAMETVSARVETTSAQPPAGTATEEPFDLASLPSIESIAADTDIGAFLQSGIPVELTRAALRRAWASDPAIRDFIGIAESQWDFNDPDGIPGFGPLLPTDSAPAVLTQASGRLENIPEVFQQMPSTAQLAQSSATDPELTLDEPHSADSGNSDSPDKDEVGGEANKDRAVGEYDASRNRRRHGSALPR